MIGVFLFFVVLGNASLVLVNETWVGVEDPIVSMVCNNISQVIISSQNSSAFVGNLVTNKFQVLGNASNTRVVEHSNNYIFVANLATINIYDLSVSLNPIMSIKNTAAINQMKYISKSNELAVVSVDGKLCLWNVGPLTKTYCVLAHAINANKVLISKDQQTIYTGGQDNSVRIWDRKTGKGIKTLISFQKPITALVQFNQYLLVGMSDGIAKLIQMQNYTVALVKPLHNQRINAFSLNIIEGKQILTSVSEDSTMKRWLLNRNSLQQLQTLHAQQKIKTINNCNDSTYVLTGHNNGMIYMWKNTNNIYDNQQKKL